MYGFILFIRLNRTTVWMCIWCVDSIRTQPRHRFPGSNSTPTPRTPTRRYSDVARRHDVMRTEDVFELMTAANYRQVGVAFGRLNVLPGTL